MDRYSPSQIEFIDFENGYFKTTDHSVYKISFVEINEEITPDARKCSGCSKYRPRKDFKGQKAGRFTQQCSDCTKKKGERVIRQRELRKERQQLKKEQEALALEKKKKMKENEKKIKKIQKEKEELEKKHEEKMKEITKSSSAEMKKLLKKYEEDTKKYIDSSESESDDEEVYITKGPKYDSGDDEECDMYVTKVPKKKSSPKVNATKNNKKSKKRKTIQS